jgi:transcriptional regulator with XRE-family HTH domain
MPRRPMTTAFRTWREGMGYSQRQAAEELSISKETVGRYDRGERYPPKSLRRLMWAKAHDWHPEEWTIEDVRRTTPSGQGLTMTAFRAWRERVGYSRRQAAEELCISQESVERYDRGERYPPRSLRRLMSAAARRWLPRAWPIDEDDVPRL